jgi:GT2 family glycosyltransferase
MSKKKLFIIIPVFNAWEQTRTCLEHLAESTCTPDSIIVVDHGTSNETRTGLSADFPQVTRIEGSSDMWWTAATNLGIRAALEQGADLLLLLNNDCYVEKKTLETLARHASVDDNSIVAPLQRSASSGRISTHRVTSCFLLGFPTLTFPGTGKYTPDRPDLKKTGLIIGGRGATIPANVFRRAGLFNEDELPHYGADHDFYLRCRKLGIGLFIASDAVVDIDDTRTTLANNIGSLGIRQFIDTLRSQRSHRNLGQMATLFRLHYPLPGLYPVGVLLNLLRYLSTYVTARLMRLSGMR